MRKAICDKEVCPIFKMMPIIATVNIKEKQLYNTIGFKVGDINKVGDKYEFTEIKFANSFIPSFCLTVHKYQGWEINSDYNIFDINHQDKILIYNNKTESEIN